MERPIKLYPNRISRSVGAGFAWAALLAISLSTPGEAESSYGHIRTVVGRSSLLSGSAEPGIDATANYPIQVGDRVLVSPGAKLEVVLPDGGLLRFDGNSELKFTRLANSLQSDDDRNFLELLQGQVQVSVVSEPVEPAAFRIDTANSSLFLLSQGSYRIFADGKSWTQVIVREGFVEIATERGTSRVSAGQQAIIDGDRSPKVTVQASPPLDSLEQWASRLDADARTVEAQIPYRRGYVSPSLGYAAAPLYRHGRWMRYRDRHVWRPHVSIGWRPYHSGWWVYTPAGLTWVSTEPWGWVPYHYGNWGHASGIGWVWYPGQRYTPGAVYWYWGPTHVGWIPTGYYHDVWSHSRYAMPPFGHHGSLLDRVPHPGRPPFVNPLRHPTRAGSDVAIWRDWTFSAYDKFGYRDNHRFLETGADLENRGVFQSEVPRGVMTTETRDLTPNLWDEPERVLATLEHPRFENSRKTRLSPLGAAALSGTSTSPWQTETRPPSSRTRPQRLVRQWDPGLWRRDHRTRPQSIEPYRRDTRSSSMSLRGYQGSPTARQDWRRQPPSGMAGHSLPTRPRVSRPRALGGGRNAVGGSRPSSAPPRSGLGTGRSSAPGRSSTGTSVRNSGPGRAGRSMKSGATRSTSTGGGSG